MIQQDILNRAKKPSLYGDHAQQHVNVKPSRPAKSMANKLDQLVSKMTFVETTKVASKPLVRPFSTGKFGGSGTK